MPESIAQRTAKLEDQLGANEIRALLTQIRLDIATLRTSLLAVCTKLDADAGVTDTNYNSTTTTALGTQQLQP